MTDYTTVPAGRYVCRIEEVRTGTTRSGDVRWSVRLVVAEGEHEGRTAAWDALVFSVRGRIRARRIFEALDLPARGRVSVEPQELEGRTALVDVRPMEFGTPDGETVRRNEVPYDGWQRAGCPGCGSACWTSDPDTGRLVCESCGYVPSDDAEGGVPGDESPGCQGRAGR